MSKLFDTLEKIQTNETFSPTPGVGITPSAKPKGNKIVITLVALAVCAVGLFFVLQSIETFKLPGITTKQSAHISIPTATQVLPAETTSKHSAFKVQKIQPVTKPVKPIAKELLHQMTTFNNQGVRLIAKSEYWQGIYYFNKAHALSPQSIEPLVNMAVALMELGLTAPANRFFHEALTLDPNNPKLRDNLALAAQTGTLDNSLLNLVTGEPIFP
jgi:tetratricopeptide (TPR) repeat protein